MSDVMTLNMVIEALVEPFAKDRPRFGGGATYMSSKYRRKKERLASYFVGLQVPEGHVLHFDVVAYRKLPKSWSRKKVAAARGQYTTAGPDIDNIIGAVLDAALADDSIVVAVSGEKRWSDREDGAGHMAITIKSINAK